MSNIAGELRAALDAAPDNTLLRLMLVRDLIGQGATAEAMTMAMALDPAGVTAPGDRQLLARMWVDCGLPDRAAAYQDADSGVASGPAPTPAPTAVPSPARGTPLRVVGGTDPTPDMPTEDAQAPLSFADVGGLEDVKRDIRRRIILPFAQPSLVARFKKSAGGGVLLYGPPGCGKTLLARATAGECGALFLHAPLSEILDPRPGESERRLSALFRKARESAPAIIFFDEIEALAAKRSSATSSHVGQLISHFLHEFDGVDANNKGVLVLAATNTPWAMDPAFLRPGRFDRLFFVPPPDAAARAGIFGLELGDRPVAPDVDPADLARRTSGASGADIRAIVEMATDEAIDATLETGQEVPLDGAMLKRAVEAHRSTVGDWLATAKDYATYANESGRYDDVLAFLDRYARK
ncbi:MAG: ATP-binding protein [Pseudomonadota bacterium]